MKTEIELYSYSIGVGRLGLIHKSNDSPLRSFYVFRRHFHVLHFSVPLAPPSDWFLKKRASLGQLTSHRLNWPSFGKGKTKVSWLISFHSLSRQCFNILIRHCNTSRIRNIKIERSKQLLSQQYTSFVLPFAETRSVMIVTSADRENAMR